jgi:HSP20 family protein
MKVIRWNPGFPMSWQNEFNRYGERPNRYVDTKMGLAVDVFENDSSYVVKASVPGINVEDVEITFEDEVLTIKGEIQNDSEEEEGTFHIRERWFGAFGRRLRFPTNVDAEAIEATYVNGILILNVPKVEEAQPKRIEVKAA